MTSPGDIVLTRLPQAGGRPKLRPALVVCVLPGTHRDVLVAGISSQVQNAVPDWDELILADDPDFTRSGLRAPSIVRLSYLAVLAEAVIAGGIGRVDSERLVHIATRLARHIQSGS